MLEDIKINLAYDQILAYDELGNPYVKINLFQYNVNSHTIDNKVVNTFIKQIEKDFRIKFPYTIKIYDEPELKKRIHQLKRISIDLDRVIDNFHKNFIIKTLDELYDSDENFIYPILLDNNDIFNKYVTIDLPEKLIESIHKKKGRIFFFQVTEGYFGSHGNINNDYIWISNLSSRYNLQKEDIVVVSANFSIQDQFNNLVTKGVILDNFTVFSYNYCQYNLFFHYHNTGKMLNPDVRTTVTEMFNYFLNNNKKIQKQHHFLCFNRVPKDHRVAIFSEILSNPNLRNKSIITLARTGNSNPLDYYNRISNIIEEDYKYDKNRLLEFLKNYDSTQHFIYDEIELDSNKSGIINNYIHGSTFINIVTESLFNEKNATFFSEKTFKPIYACQPFIIISTPGFLKKMKELGYQTFEQWWDESYDTEENLTRKLEKIVEILTEISFWSMDKCFQITQEMEPILVHNFNTMLNLENAESLFYLMRS